MNENLHKILIKAQRDIVYPFDQQINININKAMKESLAWLKKCGIIQNSKDLNKVKAIKTWEVISYAYPSAPLTTLTFLINWTSWILLSDDDYDESIVGKDPLKVSLILNSYQNILSQKKPLHNSRFTKSLKLLNDRMRHIFPKVIANKFVIYFREYLEGCLLESFFRKSNIVPTLNEYEYIRLLSVGMKPYFIFCEALLESKLLKHFTESKEYEQAMNLAARIIAWANDIYSFPKEVKNNELFNLIFVLINQDKISINKAYEKAIAMHNFDLESFLLLEKKILNNFSKNEKENRVIASWFLSLKNWIIGAWNWTLQSGRYSIELNVATNFVFLQDSSSHKLPS